MSTTFKNFADAANALTVTIGLSSGPLASDTNLLAGRQGSEVDCTAFSGGAPLDVIVAGKITTGTSPTAAKEIDVYLFEPDPKTGTYPDVITNGGDANKTLTSAEVRNIGGKLLCSIPTNATSNTTYYFSAQASQALGHKPYKFVPFVVHNTGVALNATSGNHAMDVTPEYTIGV